MPYWDWTAPHATVPALAADATYTDPHTGKTLHNPFYDAEVAFLGERTSREVGIAVGFGFSSVSANVFCSCVSCFFLFCFCCV